VQGHPLQNTVAQGPSDTESGMSLQRLP
jgi:hypothetical protein